MRVIDDRPGPVLVRYIAAGVVDGLVVHDADDRDVLATVLKLLQLGTTVAVPGREEVDQHPTTMNRGQIKLTLMLVRGWHRRSPGAG
jgi:hypothetical protein